MKTHKISKIDKSGFVQKNIPIDIHELYSWLEDEKNEQEIFRNLPSKISIDDDGEITYLTPNSDVIADVGNYGQFVYSKNKILPDIIETIVDTAKKLYQTDSLLHQIIVYPPSKSINNDDIFKLPPADIAISDRIIISVGGLESFKLIPLSICPVKVDMNMTCKNCQSFKLPALYSSVLDIQFDSKNSMYVEPSKGIRGGNVKKNPTKRFVILIDLYQNINESAKNITNKLIRFTGKDSKITQQFTEYIKSSDFSLNFNWGDLKDQLCDTKRTNQIFDLLGESTTTKFLSKIKLTYNNTVNNIKKENNIEDICIGLMPKNVKYSEIKSSVLDTIDNYKSEEIKSSSKNVETSFGCGNDEEDFEDIIGDNGEMIF